MRLAYRGAMSSKSLRTASGSARRAAARRRACTIPASPASVPRLARVISRSACPRMASALARVVRIRSCSNSCLIRIRRSAVRSPFWRPNFRPATLCRISYLLRFSLVFTVKIALLAHLGAQLIQALLAEIADGHHGLVALLEQLQHLTNGSDAGALERIEHPHREVQVFDGGLDHFAGQPAALDFFLGDRGQRLLTHTG